MASSSTNPTNLNPLHFYPQSNFNIPSKNYSHTMTLETLEISTNNIEEKVATIELYVQGFYKLFVQPFYGFQPLATENDFIVSPKYRYKLKFPLFLVTKNPYFLPFSVSQNLATLPISTGLASYIEPFIVHNAIEMGQRNGDKEFKIVFDVKVVELDLADYRECDGYRRRGLI
ncbi:hypothetical protein L195_g017119 [Trifolium pratense]|uniref:Uncharacterized protein n=2 Tax=Trifolium pratense TaxID=57577 RepID=A0ACB0J2Y8_TRIPR|nr:hypothetical protein L195_g017119 [Trifolium pratense]CAJ2639261.1 unnamed protein product [Trifolium pratense]